MFDYLLLISIFSQVSTLTGAPINQTNSSIRKEILDGLNNLDHLHFYKMHTRSQSEFGSIVEYRDFVEGRPVHQKAMDGKTVIWETVTVGNYKYKRQDDSWTRESVDYIPSNVHNTPDTSRKRVKYQFDKNVSYSFIRTDKIGDIKVNVYQVSRRSPGEKRVRLFWIGASDGCIRRDVIIHHDITDITDYYDFNVPIYEAKPVLIK